MRLLRACFLLVLSASFVGPAAAQTTKTPFPAFEKLTARPELPDPLTMLDGTKITTPAQWPARRAELKQLFQHYMYGYLPVVPKSTDVTELFKDETFLDGKATLQEFSLAFHGPDVKGKLHLLLVTPNKAAGPVPVFIGMNFCGNQALVADKRVHLPEGWLYPSCAGVENNHATDKGRGSQTGDWNLDLIVQRGYALASFCSGDVDPDTADFTDGMLPAFYPDGKIATGPDEPGAIAEWAWGYHRVVDCLVQHQAKRIDTGRIAAVGHSRNGKTTLLAAAMDERIALAIPHQAGCGGTAPSRGKIGESVKRINTSFPHWFCDEFTKFNDDPTLLPFDQHCLVALCAPRPVLLSNAEEDQWANPSGQFEMLAAADPVYKLLGVEGLAAGAKPEMDKLVKSRLGYYLRPGKHSMTRQDWEAFLDFADANLGSGVGR